MIGYTKIRKKYRELWGVRTKMQKIIKDSCFGQKIETIARYDELVADHRRQR